MEPGARGLNLWYCFLRAIGEHPPDRRVKQSQVRIAAEKEIHLRSDASSVSKPYAAPALLSVCLRVQGHRHIQLLDEDGLEACFAQDVLNEQYDRLSETPLSGKPPLVQGPCFSMVARITGRGKDFERG
jgi:hypothetical protein